MARTRKKPAPTEQPAAEAPPVETATAESPAPHIEPTSEAPIESPAEAPVGGIQRATTHAAAVGRRGPRYNEQGITDKLAGARMLEHHDPYFTIIRFEEKPSDAVREKLREASFRWMPEQKEWARPIRFDSRMQDRVNAEEVFEDVCRTVRAERGITHEFGGA